MSNIGRKDLSPTDRKRIAAHLKQDAGWSQQAIAEALKVSVMTISRDLSEFNIVLNSDTPKVGRPKGSKQPKKAKTPGTVQKQVSVNVIPEQWETFKKKTEAKGESAAAVLGEMVAKNDHVSAHLSLYLGYKLDSLRHARRPVLAHPNLRIGVNSTAFAGSTFRTTASFWFI